MINQQERTLKEKIYSVIFSAFIIVSVIFAIVVLILWLFFGLELTFGQLSIVIIWISFIFAGLTLFKNERID